METTTAPSPAPDRRRRRGRVALALVVAWGVGSVLAGSPTWWQALPSQALGVFRADHTFLTTDESTGDPVAWDNCRAIHYVVNTRGAPPHWERLLDGALDEITAASGYVFVLDGTTTDRDFLGGRYERDPVLVGWGVRREVGPIGEGAAGLGAPITYDTADGPRYGSGIILFDSLYFDTLRREGRTGAEQMIVAHEWMHVLGLGHVEQPDEVMGTGGRRTGGTGLGDGDVAGLEALRAVPCPGTT